MKSVFATKTELKDKDLEREMGNVVKLNVEDYSILKEVDDHEEFISINEIDKIINNLDVKNVPGTDQAIKKLIKH